MKRRFLQAEIIALALTSKPVCYWLPSVTRSEIKSLKILCSFLSRFSIQLHFQMSSPSGDYDKFGGDSLLEILLIDYRWIVVCFALLPLSFLFNLWFYVRSWIIFKLNSAPKAHVKKVQEIQRQVMCDWSFSC